MSTTLLIGLLVVAGCGSQPASGSNQTAPTPQLASATPTARPMPTASPAPAQSPGTFRVSGSMTGARSMAVAAALPDGRVLIAGGSGRGHDESGYPPGLATAELFDPANGSSVPTGSMAVDRQGAVAVSLTDGRVLVIGRNTAELYDVTTGQFTRAGRRSVETYGELTATLLQDGRVLLAGGTPLLGQEGKAAAEIFDPRADSFTAVSSMTVARAGHSATLLADGRVLIAGGDLYTAARPGTAEIFDARTSTFTRTGSMSAYRVDHRATLLADGRVLISGGYLQQRVGDVWAPAYLATAELFDPRTGSFTPAAGKMTTARSAHVAELLPDGRVLVVGGEGDPELGWGGWLTSAEIYDPAKGRFLPTASMTTVRHWLACAVLADGRVVLAGGTGVGLEKLSSIEIYQP